MKHLAFAFAGITLFYGGLRADETTTPGVTPKVQKPSEMPAEQTRAAQPNRWEKEIQAFEQEDKKQFPPADAALFVGSSSIRYWTTLKEDFPEIPTIRRGFGGSYLSESVFYADRIVLPYKPRLVVVFAGGNDLGAGKTPEQVLASLKEFVAKVHAALPQTRIAYISVNPTLARWNGNNKTVEFNRLAEEFAREDPTLTFLDTYHDFLGPDGKPQSEFLRGDGLHLNSEGYKKWAQLLKPSILKLYQEEKPQ